MYIPDPIEQMEARIERNIDNYVEGCCMMCGKNVGEENLILPTPDPSSPAVCFDCLPPRTKEAIERYEAEHKKDEND